MTLPRAGGDAEPDPAAASPAELPQPEPDGQTAANDVYSAAEEDEVASRLEALGYLG